MPRVETKTSNGKAKQTRYCTGCREEIETGDTFYKWSRRFGMSGRTYYRHTACGFPRPTELTSRKTAQIEEAIADNALAVDTALPEGVELDVDGMTLELELGDLGAQMEAIADVAEAVGDEYQELHDNLPENFQYGDAGQAMEAVAEALRDWADDLRSWESDVEAEAELPALSEFDSREEWLEACAEAYEQAVQAAVDACEDKLQDMPEYEG